MPDDGRLASLDKTLKDLTKRFGDGVIMRLGEATHLQVDTISTGALSLDIALGIGGIPRGRVSEIYGPESSGKTTLCLHVIAHAQKQGGVCAIIEMEHALDPIYAEVIVLDSVAALVPRAEIEGEMGDSHVGLQARLMSQALRKLSGAIKQSNTAMVFTNQLREKIGVMFGNPETTTGGRALKFYASIRLDIRRIQAIKQGGEVTGNRTRVRVTKNKLAAPFRECEFDIMYGTGISYAGDLLDLATELGFIDKRGAFFRYNDELIGQGRENAKQYLQDHPEICEVLEQSVREAAALRPLPVLSGSTNGDAGNDEE